LARISPLLAWTTTLPIVTRSLTLRRFSRLVAVAVVLLVSGCTGSTKGHSDRASKGGEQPVRAVEAYNTPAYGREIQLVRSDGMRLRFDPHPPLPIDGAWSPDGTRIAFSGGEGSNPPTGTKNLYTTAGDGSDVRLLYRGHASTPLWSPDGRWIAFLDDEGSGPLVVGADGHGAHRLADLVVESFGDWGAWSPDGKELALSGQERKHDYGAGIYAVGVDGSRLHRLTRRLTRKEINDEAGIVGVEWSPNGAQIAFVRYSDSAPTDEIDVVDANGRNERRIGRGDCPAWSPGGKRLAYAVAAGIAIVRPGRPGRLLANQQHAGCPLWFADGRRILFFTGGRPYVVDAGSASIRKATAADRTHVRLLQDPGQTVTKDGKFLDAEGDFDENNYVVRVSTLRGTVATFRWSDDYSPAWSPDRRKLMFVRLQRTRRIFIFDTIAKRLHRFAAGTDPAWSPDSKRIAFGHNNHIFVARIGAGAARPIGTGSTPAWSPDGRFVAATGGGGLFVMSPDGERRRRIDVRAVESCEGGAETPSGRPSWSHDGVTLTFSYWCEADQMYEQAVVARNEWRPAA
jgi:Tol biopolymer transport system component